MILKTKISLPGTERIVKCPEKPSIIVFVLFAYLFCPRKTLQSISGM